eukprot:COSAG03_NODE_11159_length_608_cov_1.632613_1_plen_24_part_10
MTLAPLVSYMSQSLLVTDSLLSGS